MSVDTKKIAEEIYNTIQSTSSQVKLVDRGDGFDVKDVRAILTSIDLVLTEVEKLGKDNLFGGLTGEEKKEISVDVLSRLLDFDIPWVPDFLEKKVKKYAISFVIDYSIELLNKKLNKDWLK